jgi:ParB family chromosome partitioning protein
MAESVAPAAAAASVPISKLIESKSNPRKHFDKTRLDQLAQSIANVGIISPLVVRPVPAGLKIGNGRPGEGAVSEYFELVAGARRLRAAKLAKLAEVPIIVRDISDADMLEVQLSENRDRDDLHPLEEAEGFERLLKLRKYTIDHLAERVRLDPSTVSKRVHLVHLTESLKKLFLADEITLGHAYLICRHSPANQDRIEREFLYRDRMHWTENKSKKVREIVDVESLRYSIERELLFVLAKVPWDRDDVTLLPAAGSCTGCPKRTGRNLALFDDLKASDDRCLDSRCYGQKLEAHIARVIEKAAPLTPIRIAGTWMQHLPKGVIGSDSFRKALKGSCDRTEPGVLIAGDNDIGKLIWICRDRKCKHHWRARYEKTPAQKREDELSRRIQKEQLEQLRTVTRMALKSRGYKLGRTELIWIFEWMYDVTSGTPELDQQIAERLGIKVTAHAVLLPEKMRPALCKAPKRTFNELLLNLLADECIFMRRTDFFRDLGIDVKASEKRVAERLGNEAKAKAQKPGKAKPAAKGKK